MNRSGQTVCLCMIVKNEDHVIRRCLASVVPLIDAWCIVDTGSTDGTQQTIREALKHIPGELLERPWVDFAHNRTESLQLAAGRASYLLILDADEVLEYAPGFEAPDLEAGAYDFAIQSGTLSYYKTQLVRDGLPWRYQGVVHEHIVANVPFTHERLPGVRTLRITDGARAHDPLTYRKDALLLEAALLQDPQNSRHMFYLAQSYADAGEADLSIDRYERRIAMGGWVEEIWFSQYRVAQLREDKGKEWAAALEAYLAAYAIRQDRAEPLYRIGVHYQSVRQFALAHLFFSMAIAIPYPATDILFVERDIYDYLLPLEYSVACFYVGRYTEAIQISNRLLALPDLHADRADQVIRNRGFSLEAMYPQRTSGVDLVVAAPLRVCVLHSGPRRDASACIEALRSQSALFEAVFVDQSPEPDVALQTLLRDSPFCWHSVPPETDWASAVAVALQGTSPDTIVLIIGSTDVFTDPAALFELAVHFTRYQCGFSYGQFRWAEGTRGDAYPFASAEELAGAALNTRLLPLSFRRSLWDEAAATTASSGMTPQTLLHAAGFERTRFCDRVLLTHPGSSNGE